MEGQASTSSSSSGGGGAALPADSSSTPAAGTSATQQDSNSLCEGANGDDVIQVTVVHDELTFDNRQALRLKEIERKLIEDTKRKKRDWERDVEKMREEFLMLYPVDASPSALEDDTEDGLVAKRRGSTDVLDSKKMKTLFLEYPDAGRRYKIRFNVAGFDPEHLRVATDGDRIIVRGTRREPADGSNPTTESGPTSGANEVEREYERKIEKPKEVDAAKLKSYLTTDGILIIEAPVPPKSLNLRKTNHSGGSPQRSASGTSAAAAAAAVVAVAGTGANSHHGSMTSLRSNSSPAHTAAIAPAVSASISCQPNQLPGSPSREKLGIPVFYDDQEQGRRKLALVVDVGTSFGPKEITALIIKDNRIQIKARHEERTLEKLCKNKYTKEFELAERIETYSLRGGLTADGRLYVGALAKGSANGLSKVAAGEIIEEDINIRAPENQQCNMLDLSSFPPTTPQLIANSASYNSG